jgi:hypothetical protein
LFRLQLKRAEHHGRFAHVCCARPFMDALTMSVPESMICWEHCIHMPGKADIRAGASGRIEPNKCFRCQLSSLLLIAPTSPTNKPNRRASPRPRLLFRPSRLVVLLFILPIVLCGPATEWSSAFCKYSVYLMSC